MGRTLLYSTAALAVVWCPRVGAEQVKVLATDARIAFSFNWYEPRPFDRVPAVDGFTAGGPNSSLCALGDISRLSKYEGDQFNFTFYGVSASLVMGSRVDHSPFNVTYDGATYAGDTYSENIACGAAWTSPAVPPGTVASHHTITGTNHPADGERTFLQLLSIVYDDGSSGDSEAGGVGAGGSSHRTTATPASVSSSLGTTTATGTRTSASISTRSSASSPAHRTTATTGPRPRVDPTGAVPNVPAGGYGGGGSTDSTIDSTGPVHRAPVPTTDIGRTGESGGTHQQNKAASRRLSTAAVAGIAVTGGLSCLALAWILWIIRRRCFARRERGRLIARSESFEAVLSEGAGLDGDPKTRVVEPISPGSSSFVIGSQGSTV